MHAVSTDQTGSQINSYLCPYQSPDYPFSYKNVTSIYMYNGLHVMCCQSSLEFVMTLAASGRLISRKVLKSHPVATTSYRLWSFNAKIHILFGSWSFLVTGNGFGLSHVELLAGSCEHQRCTEVVPFCNRLKFPSLLVNEQ